MKILEMENLMNVEGGATLPTSIDDRIAGQWFANFFDALKL